MILGRYEQQPSDSQDFSVSYTDWLRTGEAVAGITASVITPSGLNINNMIVDPVTQDSLSFVASGGESVTRYKLEITISTTATVPRLKQDEMYITVKEL